MKRLTIGLIVIWWCAAVLGCAPEGDAPQPPPSTTTTATPPDPPAPTTTTAPEPPPAPNPRSYIRWACHPMMLACRDRHSWARQVDFAYTVWRGDRDLEALLERGLDYLSGGPKELVDLTPGELAMVIAKMREVNARGDRLVYRIENEQHRDFDPDILGDWHRSQVRKDVAREMTAELDEQTDIYAEIAGAFPLVAGCDSIACKLGEMQ